MPSCILNLFDHSVMRLTWKKTKQKNQSVKKRKFWKKCNSHKTSSEQKKKSDFNTLIPPSLYLSKNKLHGNLLDLTDTWTNYISVSGIMMQVKIEFKKKTTTFPTTLKWLTFVLHIHFVAGSWSSKSEDLNHLIKEINNISLFVK